MGYISIETLEKLLTNSGFDLKENYKNWLKTAEGSVRTQEEYHTRRLRNKEQSKAETVSKKYDETAKKFDNQN